MDTDNKEINDKLQERFAQLPKVIQDAITSAEVEKHLRSLAETHKLHLDQWTALENEVMLTLLGFQKAEDLTESIRSQVGMPAEAAAALAEGISKAVFEPIRGELERNLEHPEAEAEKVSGIEQARTEMLSQKEGASLTVSEPAPSPASAPAASTIAPAAGPAAQNTAPQPVMPATPPPAPPSTKVERAPVSASYHAAAPSHERKSIDGDPYREQIA
jgi:hypothetical protein